MFYRIFRLFATAALRLFFRRIEIEGLSNIPTTGPLLFVPNHTNALVDPLFLIVALRRQITLTAKNTLTKNPLLWLLLKRLQTIYFHRVQDAGQGADLRANVRAFEQCRQLLAKGGAICIFPEGISHSDLQMRRFHTGVARIALSFVKTDGNPGRLQIVPVGLLYTAKEQFRSDVWIRCGEPVDVEKWVNTHADVDAGAMTEGIRRLVESQTIAFEDRREMVIVHYANEIVATQGHMPRPLGRAEPGVAEWFGRLALLQKGYRQLMAICPTEVVEVSEHIRRYRSSLKRLGVTPAEVFLPLHPARAALFLLRELELALLGAPLAIFGILNQLIPYCIVRIFARLLSKDKDQWASNVIYPSFIVFPAYELLLLALIWLMLPAFWAAIYTLALPYTAYYALLYLDREGSAWRRARTFLYFVTHRGTQLRLAEECKSILASIQALSERLPQSSRDAATLGRAGI